MSAPTIQNPDTIFVADEFGGVERVYVVDLPPAPPEPTAEAIKADLLATANVLERDGWFQGDYHCAKPEGGLSHCTLGAIGVATGYFIPGPQPDLTEDELADLEPGDLLYHTTSDMETRNRYWRTCDTLKNYLRDFGLQTYGDIAEWNDETEGLTGELVATTVRAAAEWVAA